MSGGMDGSVRVWSTQGGGVEMELEGKGHEASVDCVAYRDGKVLSASSDGSLKLWSADPEEGENNEDTVTSKRKKRRTQQKSHPTKVLSSPRLTDNSLV